MAPMHTGGDDGAIVSGAWSLLGHGLTALSGFLTGISHCFDTATAHGNTVLEGGRDVEIATGAHVTTKRKAYVRNEEKGKNDIVLVDDENRNKASRPANSVIPPHDDEIDIVMDVAPRKRKARHSPISESPSCSYELEPGLNSALGVVQEVQQAQERSRLQGTKRKSSASMSTSAPDAGGEMRKRKRSKTNENEAEAAGEERKTALTRHFPKNRVDELKQLLVDLVRTFPKWTKHKIAKEGSIRSGVAAITLMNYFDNLVEKDEVRKKEKGKGYIVIDF